LRAAITGRNEIVWEPLQAQSGSAFSPQQLAFDSPADLIFYGGAAGGGKTDLEIGLSLKAHKRSIIFRREFKQLKAIEDRLREIVGELGRYNSQDKIFRLYDGRQVELGAVEHPKDVMKYQGRPHDLICFDEVCHFQKAQTDFLGGWLRTTDLMQRTRIVYTGNPPTDADGSWVIEEFAPWLDQKHPRPAKSGELRWYAVIDGKSLEISGPDPIQHKGETIFPKSRTFIPARVQDNPHYWSTGYVRQLQGMPEPLRSQLLYGDFSIGQTDDAWQVIPTVWVKAAMDRWTDKRPATSMTALGVDVARGGECQTVLAPRFRAWFAPLNKIPGRETPDGPTAGAHIVRVREGKAVVGIDIVGVGSSPFDWLVNVHKPQIPVMGMNGAESSDATDRNGKLQFANKRAEWIWKLREALDPELGENLQLPPDRELLADLCAPRYKITASGIQVERKEDIIKRLGRSPDCGEAVIYSHAANAIDFASACKSSAAPASSRATEYSGSAYRGGY
jgi:hypothetical protein